MKFVYKWTECSVLNKTIPTPQKLGKIKEEREWKECKAWSTDRKALKCLSGQDRAMSIKISQQVWLPVLDLHKNGPISSQSPMGVEPRKPLPLPAELWANDKFWKKQSHW